MNVKMLTCLSGVDFSVNAGDLYDCSDDEGARLIAAGFAEPVEAAAQAKASGRKAMEKATAVTTGKEQRG